MTNTSEGKVAIAVLQEQMKTQSDDMKELKHVVDAGFAQLNSKMDSQSTRYLPRVEYERDKARRIATTILTVVATVVITFLATFALDRIFTQPDQNSQKIQQLQQQLDAEKAKTSAAKLNGGASTSNSSTPNLAQGPSGPSSTQTGVAPAGGTPSQQQTPAKTQTSGSQSAANSSPPPSSQPTSTFSSLFPYPLNQLLLVN